MPLFRAVIFDFFGTLTRAVQRGARHAVVADVLGCDPGALADVLHRSFYLRATGALGCAEATLRWVCEQSGARPSETALRAAAAARLDAVRADARLRADAVGSLRALRQRGLRTGLISDCTHELPALLPQLPVAPLLDVRVFSIQMGRCKPDPALYLAACGRLGLPPQHCLYVGDGDSQELTGAAATGMTAVRLAAPDLAAHFVLNGDTAWRGPSLTSLSDVVDLVDADVTTRAPGQVSAPVELRQDGPVIDEGRRPSVSPLVDEAMRKAAVAWVSVDGTPARAVWCLPHDGALYVVSGPGEQSAPGLADAATAEVSLRGDHGGRIVTWPARVTRVLPGTGEWAAVTTLVAAKRLNAPGDVAEVVDRWAVDCAVNRLAPA